MSKPRDEVPTPVADGHCRVYQDEGASYRSAFDGTEDIRQVERERATLAVRLEEAVGLLRRIARAGAPVASDIINEVNRLLAAIDAESAGGTR